MAGVHDHQRPRLPPYYHFCPTDEHLIVSYLRNYVAGRPLPYDGVIGFADVYSTEPYNLLQKSPLNKNNVAYFFSRRTNKGKRGCRAAGNGTWRLEKKREIADRAGVVVGYKGEFSFRSNCGKRQSKSTGWIMHEYVLGSKEDDKANFKPQGLYRIRWKAPGSKQDEYEEDEDQEDEDQEDEVQEDDSPAAKRRRTLVEQENQEGPVVAPDGHNIGEVSMEESSAATSTSTSTDDWLAEALSRDCGECGFSEQAAYEEQMPDTVGSSMALPERESAVAVEYQTNGCDNGASSEWGSYSVAVAPPTGDQHDNRFYSHPEAAEGHCGGFSESYAVQATSTIGLPIASTVDGNHEGTTSMAVREQAESGPVLLQQGSLPTALLAESQQCWGFSGGYGQYQSGVPVQTAYEEQMVGTIGSSMPFPAPEQAPTIGNGGNDGSYSVAFAPPTDDQLVGYKGEFSFRSNCNKKQSTGWVMHEYVLGSKEDDKANFKPQGLYRIRWKATGSKQDEDEEDEDQEDVVQEDDRPAAKRRRTLVEQENQEGPIVTHDGDNIGEVSMEESSAATSTSTSTDDWLAEALSRDCGECGFSEQAAYEEQMPDTVGSSMALPERESAVAVEYQTNGCDNGAPSEWGSYSVAVAPPTGDQHDNRFYSHPEAAAGHCGGFSESYAVQATSAIGLPITSTVDGNHEGTTSMAVCEQAESGPVLLQQGSLSTALLAESEQCWGFSGGYGQYQSGVPVQTAYEEQMVGTIGFPALETSSTIGNDGSYSVAFAPPTDDQLVGGFSSEPQADAAGDCSGFSEACAAQASTADNSQKGTVSMVEPKQAESRMSHLQPWRMPPELLTALLTDDPQWSEFSSYCGYYTSGVLEQAVYEDQMPGPWA